MATVADYVTFADKAFDLPQVAGMQNFLLNLPSNFNGELPGILAFMIEVKNAKDIHLAVGMGPTTT